MKPPFFCPYQTHSHPNLLGSIVQQFSLGIKEEDDKDKKKQQDFLRGPAHSRQRLFILT